MQNNISWREVVGYEGLYLVSNQGQVSKANGNLLSQCSRGNYKAVTLIKDKVEKLVNVHRIVASAFIENPQNLPQVNHKDEDKYNNRAENLEWCNSKYNNNYGSRVEKMINKQLKQVAAINDDGEIVAVYKGGNETKKYGYTPQAVSECCRGKRERHKGYRWTFL